MEAVIREAGAYGLVAEFTDADEVLSAAKQVHAEGYRRIDAYTPFPVHGMPEAIGFQDSRLTWLIFFGGLFGAIGGFLLQWWVSAVAYPLNVGNRPYFSWPNFIPVTFECTVLLAAFAAVFGMLGLNGFPRPHHPIFNARHFERASQDRFFLCIEATDPKFDLDRTTAFLQGLGAVSVSEVEQ